MHREREWALNKHAFDLKKHWELIRTIKLTMRRAWNMLSWSVRRGSVNKSQTRHLMPIRFERDLMGTIVCNSHDKVIAWLESEKAESMA
ncbi:hypothetical protein [Thermoactinomyces mirandus]|uniref:Uncharacterized protein n=1 Tax=Thermoactinomyces mirandus TaxID=2756294 RepID=A0A7W1XQA7_9BACL|nr:hypothetical protein [Thermoactinomyces mirandus]MBA4601202.1 hypothetical protein [Thermoactinomyces mirandus]